MVHWTGTTTNSDLKCWQIIEDANVAKSDLITNVTIGKSPYTTVGLEYNPTSEIYSVIYGYDANENNALYYSTKLYIKTSSDNGATWSSAVQSLPYSITDLYNINSSYSNSANFSLFSLGFDGALIMLSPVRIKKINGINHKTPYVYIKKYKKQHTHG